MIEFIVEGPFDIPYKLNNRIKRITTTDSVDKFWNEYPDFEDQKGCYVFALRRKSIVPYYIGKATRDFYQEIFTPHKIEKYNDVLHSHILGNPIFFFVRHPSQKGKAILRKG